MEISPQGNGFGRKDRVLQTFSGEAGAETTAPSEAFGQACSEAGDPVNTHCCAAGMK